MKKTYNSIVSVIGLGILFFFPFLGNVHLFDWDEINFAESAREMIVTGDYFRVMINYEPFWEKPPFFFWLQVISMKMFGITEFAARFPNALFGVFSLTALFLIGKKHFSEKFGLIWVLLYLGSFLPHLYFKSGIIDPVFNLFIFLSIYFLALNIGSEKEKFKRALLSGIFSGLAIITKGPVGILLVFLTFFFYLVWKKFSVKLRIKDILGFLLMALSVTSVWFGYEMYKNGAWFLIEFIKYQIELFSRPVAGHQQPFYYHFLVLLIGCFPMSILALNSFKKDKESSPIDFSLWMKVLFWVVLILFSIVKTKIIHYSSMAYFPLSFLAAKYVYGLTENKYVIKKWTTGLIIFFGTLFSTLLISTPIVFFEKTFLKKLLEKDAFAKASLNFEMGWSGYEFVFGLIYLFGLILGIIYIRKQKYIHFLYALTISAGITLWCYAIFVVPKIERFSQGPAIDFLKDVSDEDVYITTIGYKSYAPYFYGKVKPKSTALKDIRSHYIHSLKNDIDFNVAHLNSIIDNWLLRGDIDKKAYFITKINKRKEMKKYKKLDFIKNSGGFDFYKREVDIKHPSSH